MPTLVHKTLESTFATTDGARFTATISTDSIDRDGEVVIPAGMNSKEYERNPVLLYAHDATRPIGRMDSLKRGENSITGEFSLAPRPDSHEGEWFPDTVASLMRFGALRGTSVGFTAQAGGVRMASKADLERYGGRVKRVFSKWNLLEVSVVSIPANQDALISAVTKGIVTASAAKAFGFDASAPELVRAPAVVRVTVPALGLADAADAARIALARARGRFRP